MTKPFKNLDFTPWLGGTFFVAMSMFLTYMLMSYPNFSNEPSDDFVLLDSETPDTTDIKPATNVPKKMTAGDSLVYYWREYDAANKLAHQKFIQYKAYQLRLKNRRMQKTK